MSKSKPRVKVTPEVIVHRYENAVNNLPISTRQVNRAVEGIAQAKRIIEQQQKNLIQYEHERIVAEAERLTDVNDIEKYRNHYTHAKSVVAKKQNLMKKLSSLSEKIELVEFISSLNSESSK